MAEGGEDPFPFSHWAFSNLMVKRILGMERLFFCLKFFIQPIVGGLYNEKIFSI
ncbi:hypothetical protein NSQ61_17725 [Aeribacillus sp. FSL K6-1121]|jgi:hypothetical protein|uniref:hypothetical protein n=1 Tax=Aeribacillus TaxID=1055323 RepID=UPI0012FD6EDF|nr:hypothetical protein [Aeribacillus pallidus]BBU41075.1 hypothetical protein APP_33670 [Aeribacillus pallidus]